MHYDMSWRDFELMVEDSVRRALDPVIWRINSQWARTYSDMDGNERSVRMDIHIAERRQGGRGFVIDAKHYTRASLATDVIDSTLDYKRSCNASKAIIIYSDTTNVTPPILNYAKSRGVEMLQAKRNLVSDLRRLFDSF